MKTLTALALGLTLLSNTACAQSAPNTTDKAQMDNAIHTYLMENPAALRDALDNLDRWEKEQAFAAVKPLLYDDPHNISIGADNAKVTIVEFFDYNCGYCKQSTDWVVATLEAHPDDVRVIFKELPLLDSRSRTSRNAAKAALAAHRQGKYMPMHVALMNETVLTEDRLEVAAKEAGLDLEMWKKDMADDVLDRRIEENFLLAAQIPDLSGTPFFVIGDTYIPGANVARLQAIVDAELER